MSVSLLAAVAVAGSPSPAPEAPAVPSSGGAISAGQSSVRICFDSLTCSRDLAVFQNSVTQSCIGCAVAASCTTALQCATTRRTSSDRQLATSSTVMMTVAGATATINAFVSSIQSGSVYFVPPTASVSQWNYAPGMGAVPSALAPSTPNYWLVRTTTATTCVSATDCYAFLLAQNLDITTVTEVLSCTCTVARQTGFTNYFVSPASAIPAAQLASALASLTRTCVNVFPAGVSPATSVPVATSCPGKGSKKGLLGLLGLLGIIPLVIGCALLGAAMAMGKKKPKEVDPPVQFYPQPVEEVCVEPAQCVAPMGFPTGFVAPGMAQPTYFPGGPALTPGFVPGY